MTVKQIIPIALTVMLGVGCANTEDGMPEEKHVISIAPYTADDATRGTPIRTATDLSEIEIRALRSDSHQPYFTATASRNPADNLFTFHTPYYWLPGALLDFCAITPSAYVTNITCDGRLSFDYSGTDDGGGDDILTGCTYGLDYATHNGLVPINMQHALSMIEFAVAYEVVDGEKVSKIGKDIIISELGVYAAKEGHCMATQSNVSWTSDASPNWIVQNLSDGTKEGLQIGTDIQAGDYINTPDRSKVFMVIPGQELSTLRIGFIESTVDPFVKEIPITPITLEAGKAYTFYIAIKSSEASVESTAVEDWKSSGNTDITIQ